MKKEYKFEFDVYDSINDLAEEDAALLRGAIEVTKNAYAPYSNFHVGAKARMFNGELISGSNQENASFPVGICAERTLLSVAASIFPNEPIDTIAISYDNLNGDSNHPISPCGICRQSLVEYEARGKKSIRIIMAGKEGQVYVLDTAKRLLPFSFTADDMKS
jgi:cytidine deaminase